MSRKTITTIMPNYNDAKYIDAAIRGVVGQTRPPDQIIFVDDASTDNSLEIVEALNLDRKIFRIIAKPANLGVVDSFNTALAQTTTDYVNFVSMDDTLNPTWIEKSMGILETFPEAGICFTDLFHQYETGFRPFRAFLADQPVHMTGDAFAHYIGGHFISGTSVVVKTDKLIEAGGYLPQLRWHSDWFAWLVVAARYGACYIPECLVTLLVRDTSHSEVGKKNDEDQREVLRHIMRLLNSDEFADVFPHFVMGQLLRHWNNYMILDVTMRCPELLTVKSTMLLHSLLADRTTAVDGIRQERSRRSHEEMVRLSQLQG